MLNGCGTAARIFQLYSNGWFRININWSRIRRRFYKKVFSEMHPIPIIWNQLLRCIFFRKFERKKTHLKKYNYANMFHYFSTLLSHFLKPNFCFFFLCMAQPLRDRSHYHRTKHVVADRCCVLQARKSAVLITAIYLLSAIEMASVWCLKMVTLQMFYYSLIDTENYLSANRY